jgi:C-terminal processing protease CtpA/Prc
VPWELVGIAPDIRIDQTEEDITQGRDRQLEFTIELLR